MNKTENLKYKIGMQVGEKRLIRKLEGVGEWAIKSHNSWDEAYRSFFQNLTNFFIN